MRREDSPHNNNPKLRPMHWIMGTLIILPVAQRNPPNMAKGWIGGNSRNALTTNPQMNIALHKIH